MRCVVQRVASSSVSVGGKTVGAIGPGLMVLIGISADDTDADLKYLDSYLTFSDSVFIYPDSYFI